MDAVETELFAADQRGRHGDRGVSGRHSGGQAWIPAPSARARSRRCPSSLSFRQTSTLPCQSRPRRNNALPARKPSRTVPRRSVLPTTSTRCPRASGLGALKPSSCSSEWPLSPHSGHSDRGDPALQSPLPHSSHQPIDLAIWRRVSASCPIGSEKLSCTKPLTR